MRILTRWTRLYFVRLDALLNTFYHICPLRPPEGRAAAYAPTSAKRTRARNAGDRRYASMAAAGASARSAWAAASASTSVRSKCKECRRHAPYLWLAGTAKLEASSSYSHYDFQRVPKALTQAQNESSPRDDSSLLRVRGPAATTASPLFEEDFPFSKQEGRRTSVGFQRIPHHQRRWASADGVLIIVALSLLNSTIHLLLFAPFHDISPKCRNSAGRSSIRNLSG